MANFPLNTKEIGVFEPFSIGLKRAAGSGVSCVARATGRSWLRLIPSLRRRAHHLLEATPMAFNDNRVGISMLNLSRNFVQFQMLAARALFQHAHFGRQKPAGEPGDGDDRGVPVLFEALSDDGPFHRLTDAEARRQVTFACVYYGCLAAALLAALVWH